MHLLRLFIPAVLILFSATSHHSQAAIINVPTDRARIQWAVNEAMDGDTILIAPGTYKGIGNREVHIIGKGLTIIGVGDPAQVIINPNDTIYFRAFAVIDPPSLVRFQNLTIQNAWAWDNDTLYAWSGAGILAVRAEVEITNCRFLRTAAIDYGGGVFAESSTVIIEGCSFDSCSSSAGGAVYCSKSSTCISKNSSFNGCGGLLLGGGVCIDGSSAIIENCDFLGNLALPGLFGDVGYGGAISAWDGAEVDITKCRFLNNWTYYRGGAVHSQASDLRISSSLFVGNRVRCNWPDGQPFMGGEGAAIASLGGSCSIDSCTIVGSTNVCSRSAVYLISAPANVNRTIIADSDSAFAFEGNAQFTCSNIYGNALGDWTGAIADQLGKDGNISADPQFCGAFSDDYRVATSSPCSPSNNDCNQRMGSEVVGCDLICGDADFSGIISISDAVFLITYIFANGDPPVVLSQGDVDCNGLVNISDVVYLINYVFGSGPTPCAACP